MRFFKNLSIVCGALSIIGGVYLLFVFHEPLAELGIFLPCLVSIVLTSLLWFMIAAVLSYLMDIKSRGDSIHTAIIELKHELTKNTAPKDTAPASSTFIQQSDTAGTRVCKACKAIYPADRNSCPQCGTPK